MLVVAADHRQYFLWYLILLPFYLPYSSLLASPRLGLTAAGLWVGTQVCFPPLHASTSSRDLLLTLCAGLVASTSLRTRILGPKHVRARPIRVRVGLFCGQLLDFGYHGDGYWEQRSASEPDGKECGEGREERAGEVEYLL